MATALAPLRLPAFRRLLAAYAVNGIGTWFGETALALVVLHHTGSPAAVAAVYVAGPVRARPRNAGARRAAGDAAPRARARGPARLRGAALRGSPYFSRRAASRSPSSSRWWPSTGAASAVRALARASVADVATPPSSPPRGQHAHHRRLHGPLAVGPFLAAGAGDRLAGGGTRRRCGDLRRRDAGLRRLHAPAAHVRRRDGFPRPPPRQVSNTFARARSSDAGWSRASSFASAARRSVHSRRCSSPT